MHLVGCHIDLAGDPQQVMVRDIDRPVAWTEIPILQALHGHESVYNVDVLQAVPNPSAQEEKLRLASIYGEEVTEKVYPGFRPNFEWDMPGAWMPPAPGWTSSSATPPDDEDEDGGGSPSAEADAIPSNPSPPTAEETARFEASFGGASSAAAEARARRAAKQGHTGAFRRTPEKRLPPNRKGAP